MLTLSLLLGAAAGVNAFAGGGVTQVNLTDGVHLCIDSCHYKGVLFSEAGHYCPIEEAVHIVLEDGTDSFSPPYQCAGEELPDGFTERQLHDGEKPLECVTSSRGGCLVPGNLRGRKEKIIEWSEVVEELKKAKAQDAQSSPEKPSPAPKEPVDCAGEGSKAFQKCQRKKNPTFSKCSKEGLKAVEACRQK
ncbi:hypothetical protein BBAD15_g11046 [Beauveria bassiana D1-5]|uniref:Uncharacterized protein n=1 Tax=Beauveria bassiana D1-5 TaxID=1245745 RepID=A0A0A2V8A6_BEABA|nr:hypothetical protein BBAD15_g11046 [Beauveria bassiana D1-5]